jgi:SNF2 family DNA or RNA helicase
VELVQGLHDEGHAVLAFSPFTSLLDRVEARLTEAGLPY